MALYPVVTVNNIPRNIFGGIISLSVTEKSISELKQCLEVNTFLLNLRKHVDVSYSQQLLSKAQTLNLLH